MTVKILPTANEQSSILVCLSEAVDCLVNAAFLVVKVAAKSVRVMLSVVKVV